MNILTKYPESVAERSIGGAEIEQGIKIRLERSKAHYERELVKINAALDALNDQPETAKLLELVMKAL